MMKSASSARVKWFFQPEGVFLLLGSLFGLLFCAASVPFMVPDEFAHFYRAYQISQIKGLPEARSSYLVGGELPKSFHRLEEQFDWMTKEPASRVQASTLMQLLRTPLEAEKRDFFNFKNSAIYSPLGYLPQALGIGLGRLFRASLLGIFYLGRLFNLLIWLALTWLAVRCMPTLKWALVVLALMPMTISQAASMSIDGLLTGLCFLFIARICRIAWDEAASLDWYEIGLWIVLLTFITQCKSAYLVLGGLVLLVPVHKVGSLWKLLAVLVLALSIPALAYFAWVQILALHGISMATTGQFDPVLQARMILAEPAAFAILVNKTFWNMALPWVVSAIGYFGWLNQPQPPVVYPLYIVFAFLVTLFDNHYPKVQVRVWQRIVSAGVVAFFTIAVTTSIYIISNPVNYGKIEGVQGRYFIPMGILLSIIICNRALRLPEWVIRVLAAAGSVAFLVVAVMTVGSRIQF